MPKVPTTISNTINITIFRILLAKFHFSLEKGNVKGDYNVNICIVSSENKLLF